jgi:hypothetical protein
MHAATVSANAEQLNHVVKTCICDCAAEALSLILFIARHIGGFSPGPEVKAPTA